MKPVIVNISIKGAQRVDAKLSGVAQRATDLTPAMKRGGIVMLASVNRNFGESGRPSRWVPLAPGTVRQKARLGYSPLPLIRTGVLRASISPSTSTNSLKIGTSVPYAKYHQLGTRSIPARPYLVFQKQDIRELNQIVKEYIMGGD